MEPMEPWQRVWIDAQTYSQDVHSYINCTSCHGGTATNDMELAHEGMVVDATADPIETCGDCHPNIAPYSANSLHSTLAGYDTALHARSDPIHFDQIEVMEANHCNDCHATCGDCHVSQPRSVGGGLLEAHTFVESPPQSQTCTACHGSRVQNEFQGLNETPDGNLPGDVHYRAFMSCQTCHSGSDMHGISSAGNTHRYDGEQSPSCESCHQEQIGAGSGIEMHEIHGTESLSCQVCHSIEYTNCIDCHVDLTENDLPRYTVADHSLGFYIGRNPIRNSERPYEYVTLRHVPIDRSSFSFYGEESDYGANLMPNFDNRETWVYATPHNIQRNTPQTASCTSCHGNADVFLTEDNVDPAEINANQNVIVFDVPPLPDGYEDRVTQPESSSAGSSSSGSDSPDESYWGEDDSGSDASGESSEDESYWGDESPSESNTNNDEAYWGEDESASDNSTNSDEAYWGDEDPNSTTNNSSESPSEGSNNDAVTDEDYWAE